MKKIIILMIFTFFCFGCEKGKEDAIIFKDEYEKLNGVLNENNHKEYPTLKINEENPIKYATYDELYDVIENDTGIIYLGYPSCPWCRNVVPALLEAAKQKKVETIYYMNLYEERDVKNINSDGNIEISKEGSKGYHKLVTYLYDFLPAYSGLEDESIKRIYVPAVVFVKEGKVLDVYMTTVESQKDPYIFLDEDQFNELVNIYINYIEQIENNVCAGNC